MKKILIGSYILITLAIIFIISNNGFKAAKDQKSIEAGAKVYKLQCAACHGETGKGEGAKQGTSLNNNQLLSALSNKDIYNNVKFGRKGTMMPAYENKLTEKQLNQLTVFIRNWQSEQIKFTVPVNISGDPENGKKLYGLYCLSCHGEAGAGKLKMGTALSNQNYLQHTTDKQIWIGAAYGREKTRMSPSLKGLEGIRQLKENEISDVVSYIRSLQNNRK